jgi:inosine-uridine nucleoside N-ribohydrolase
MSSLDSSERDDEGNMFSVPSNRCAEFNLFLDLLATETVLKSRLNTTLIPLATQRKVASFEGVLGALEQCTEHTSEVTFVHMDCSTIDCMYHHMVNDPFLDSLVT